MYFVLYIVSSKIIKFSNICRGGEVVGELGLSDVCEADLSALRYICECVSRRAGFMCAAGLTALIKKMDYKVVIKVISIENAKLKL